MNNPLSGKQLQQKIQDLEQEIRVLLKDCERFRQIVDCSPSVIYSKDLEGRYTLVNRQFENLSGLTRREILGKTDFELFPAAVAENSTRNDRRVLKEKRPLEIEEFGPVQENLHSFLSTKYPLQTADGDIYGMCGISKDITERKRAEATLEESEKNYRGLVSSLQDWIWAVDTNGLYTHSNRAVENILGYTVEEILNHPVFFLAHSDHESRARTAYAQAVDQRRGWKKLELKWRHKNGSLCYLESTSQPLLNEKGNLIGFTGLDHDITHFREAEIEQLEHQKQLKAINWIGALANSTLQLEMVLENILKSAVETLNASAGMIFLHDPAAEHLVWGAFLGLSKAFVTEFKRKPIQPGEGLTGRIFQSGRPIYIRLDSSHDSRIVRSIIAKEGLNSFIGVPLYADEKIVGVMNILSRPPIELDKKKLDLCEAIGAHVGSAVRNAMLYEEKVRVEKSLRESEEKYRNMMEAMTDPTYICSHDLIIEYMNPAMVRKIGYDATGKSCHKVLYDEPEKCSWCDFDTIQRERYATTEKIDPTGRHYLINSAPIPRPSTLPSKISIFRDITDIKIAEKEKIEAEMKLQQAQKMESIGTLAGGIAHDFNNVLTAIIGFTELTLEDMEPDTVPAYNLQQVYTAALRARDLVKQILTFARQTGGEFRPIRVDIIAKEALKLLRSSTPTTIEIRQRIESDALIVGDATQVHQVLMNLCTNAVQAMEETGGILEVKLMEVTLDEECTGRYDNLQPGPHLRLSVSDTGPGIPPDVRDAIFEPYFTTKGLGEGTGLGLAMVHGILQSHKGEIMVETAVGKGSTFIAYFPVTKRSALEKPVRKKDLPTGTERILVIDDEPPIARIESQILQRLGYRITTATSSVEALDLFRKDPDSFDLVLTDMTMPKLTGDKLAVELMKIRPKIPVILCSGYNRRISAAAAAEIGIRAFITKPVGSADLAATVRKVLDAGT